MSLSASDKNWPYGLGRTKVYQVAWLLLRCGDEVAWEIHRSSALDLAFSSDGLNLPVCLKEGYRPHEMSKVILADASED